MKSNFWMIVSALIILLITGGISPVVESESRGAYAPKPQAATLQNSATVSGTIRHAGNPVQGAVVEVVWESGAQSSITNSNGHYSVAGVPTGGWIQIFVRPPIANRLAFRNWATEALTGDLIKDFDLVSGYRLEGVIQSPDGSPYTQVFWLGASPVGYLPPEGEWIGDNVAPSGSYDMVLPPGIFRLNANVLPLYIPGTTVDLRNSDITGLVITLVTRREPPFPAAPPRGDLITAGSPDVDGYAAITGAPGSVEPLSAVVVVNLSARTLVTTTSETDGSFSTTLFAPPGSSLLIKHDPDGFRTGVLWRGAAAGVTDGVMINPLPGTILHIGAPPVGDGSSQDFASANVAWEEETLSWAGWWLSGKIQVPPGGDPPSLSVQPGEPVTITATLRVHSPSMGCTGTPTYAVQANVFLRRMFNTEGRPEPWMIWFNAHLFTPTGLPIEHEGSIEVIPVASEAFTSLACQSSDTFSGELTTTFAVPAGLPEGIYKPEMLIMGDMPRATGVPLIQVWYHFEPIASLPHLIVGSPAPGHIPWTLLGDYPVNGHRGVQAREDVGDFAMPTRVVLPPHKVVIPRLDARTGEPLVYRLEPGSHWLSATDRRQPNPPHIPLKLPSGMLTAEVFKPDGTVDTLGPATILGSSVRTPTTPGGDDIAEGTGQIGDLYHLSTMDDAFAYKFDQDGPHTIQLLGEIQDIYGHTYSIHSTYDITVARVLDLDPAQLPTTPYVQGDFFAPGLHLFPPVPAEVTVQLVQMPESDPAQAITTTITGQANRFGYFQPDAGSSIPLVAPGEFRVDIQATYTAPDGTLWMGAMTWGNVIEGPDPGIEAHGRRGMDYKSDTIDPLMPIWFANKDLLPHQIGIENYYPYFSGDIHWGAEDARDPWKGDSIHSILTFKDLSGPETFYNLLRSHYPRARSCFRWPPTGCTAAGLEERIAIGEAPLFITTQSGVDPELNPDDIDLWGYWYGSSERPDVHVREIISEDGMGTAYWRFNDTYGYQIGEPADGDQPGDLKWEFGGIVLRKPSQAIHEYAIYSSLWVLLPHNDSFGPRVTPPFQDATGASINGGPIMTLLGEEIDMLFLPKGVRPGDVLEVGDTVSFSGHVGPPMDSRVEVMITAPSGAQHSGVWHASKIGWLYDPGFDFMVNEPGRWTVDVLVEHDRPYVGNGVIPQNHNTGTVLGTSGRYEFYVVEAGTPRLFVYTPSPGFLSWPQAGVIPVEINGVAPPGTATVHYTIHDKGVVMGQGALSPDPTGVFTLVYDAEALHADFPMLSLTAREGRWQGLAGEVAVNFLAVGSTGPRAATVTLIGEEVFIHSGSGEPVKTFLPVAVR